MQYVAPKGSKLDQLEFHFEQAEVYYLAMRFNQLASTSKSKNVHAIVVFPVPLHFSPGSVQQFTLQVLQAGYAVLQNYRMGMYQFFIIV